MRKTVAVVLTLCFVLGALAVSRADDAADARAIIAKGLKAAGGEERLAKFQAMTWSEKGTYYGMGNGLEYTGVYSVQYPDKFRMEIQGFATFVLNGDKGWINMGGNTEEMNKAQLEEQQAGQYYGWVSRLVPLKDKAYKLSLLAESKVGDRPVAGVKVARDGHYDVDLYFDKETGDLLKTSTRLKEAMSGKEVEQEASYSDHKDVDGIKVPTKISIKRDGKLFVEAVNSDIKLAEKLDDSVFAKP
jgi:outer membrane lipoprotein-sorting protein